jgi:gas vesicle protein
MNGFAKEKSDYRFLAGLVMGSIVGGGLALLLAPRAAAEIKGRAIGAAKSLGDTVGAGYRDAKHRVTDTVDGLARKGEGVRDDVCDTVVRGAQDVERGAKEVQRYATDAKTHKVA